MRDVVQWVTTGGGHCSQFLKMRGREVRKRFGMSLLLVPWHGRMWGMVQQIHIPRLLRADARKFLNALVAMYSTKRHLLLPHEWVPNVV